MKCSFPANVTFGIYLFFCWCLPLSIQGEPKKKSPKAFPIQLATYPSLSADGKRIVFGWAGDVWIASANGGKAKKVTTHPAYDGRALISPDGKEMAFMSNRSGVYQVWVMPLRGGTPRQVTFHSEGSRPVDWYSDGNFLLVEGNRDFGTKNAYRFYRVNAKKRDREILLFDVEGSEPVLSPDGKRLLFCREGKDRYRKGYRGSASSQIWLAENLESSSPKFTKIIARESGAQSPMWKPNGTGFYYLGDHGQKQRFDVWEHNFDDSPEVQLTFSKEETAVFSRISRDGSSIVYRRGFDFFHLPLGRENKQEKRIKLTATGDTLPDFEYRRTLTKASNISYSPDGLEMVFAAGGDLWVMDTVLREPIPVTQTPAEEREPVFSRDGKTLFFIRDKGDTAEIHSAGRADEKRFWWQNREFVDKQLTKDGQAKNELQSVPGGKRISWISGLGDLWVSNVDGSGAKRILESWNQPSYSWAPDGKWIAWSMYDNDFNRDIWIANSEEKKKPFNVSRHPDYDGNPHWSPDGKILAFTGRRFEKETDLYYVYLKEADEEIDKRDRKLKEALDKMEKTRRPSPPPKPKPAPAAKPKAKAKPKAVPTPSADSEKKEEIEPAKPAVAGPGAAPKPSPLQIDFEGLYERIHRISIPNATESGLFWAHDSKRLAFHSEVKGYKGTYYVTFPDKLTPSLLTSKQGGLAQWIAKDDRISWLVSGIPSTYNVKTKVSSSYTFKAQQNYDRREYWRTGFRQIWRTMRDQWYDENLNNLDWDAVGQKYENAAAGAVDSTTFDRVATMMLGELNGSHLGFKSSTSSSTYRNPQGWSKITPHLGVTFDRFFDGPGWRIRMVVPEGPADQVESRLQRDDVILEVDGTEITKTSDPTRVLNGSLDRDINLKVKRAGAKADANPETVRVRPISYASARSLLKEARIKYHRSLVDKLSEGRLGYVYVPRMQWNEFVKFEEEIFARGAGKEGLIIDVRDNSGGFTADHLLTVLTPAEHATTVGRGGGPGYPQDRLVYATWRKPITVLCNQNSFSNAEIFGHAIKELERGKLVGVPTAGGVISTGSKRIMDMGTLRLPHRGWFRTSDGADMELNGAIPDHIVWPNPEDNEQGKDRQIEKAVEVLLKEIEVEKQKPRPAMVPASRKRKAPDQ